jgi:hypothetical protein
MTRKRTTRKKEPFIVVEIEKRMYNDFKDLYNTNRDGIYRGVLDIYTEFKNNSRKRVLTLLVSTDMGPLSWDTEFIFKKLDYQILIEQILPYYEDNEDYEKCAEIKNLHDYFANIN